MALGYILKNLDKRKIFKCQCKLEEQCPNQS